jgi:hypothetical protein
MSRLDSRIRPALTYARPKTFRYAVVGPTRAQDVSLRGGHEIQWRSTVARDLSIEDDASEQVQTAA